jgi:hypothetical protein
MPKPFTTDEPLPPGLSLTRGDGVFWWTRRTQPLGKLFAVCIQKHRKDVEVSVFSVVGCLDRRPAKRDETRLKAMKMLVRSEQDSRVFRTVYGYARDSTLTGTADAHWIFVRAASADEARDNSDVRFILSRIKHYQMTHAFHGIYFISNGHGAVKIGRTGSSLATRLNACQTGSPHELYIVAAIEHGQLSKLERRLHRENKAVHMRGEWFAMDDSTAIRIALSHGGRRWDADSLFDFTGDEVKS